MKTMIENKAIVLTGASSGIGRAVALKLGRERARLLLVARREERLVELVNEIQANGGVAFAEALDLINPESVRAMVQCAQERLGRIDVLINNAGFGYFGTVESIPPSVVRDIFALNFEAPLLASQLVIPIMRRQGGGHIINISSIAGKRGLPLSGIYCATKFALNGLSEALRLEVRDAHIHLSLVYPASTMSEFRDSTRRGDVIGSFKAIGPQQTSEEVAESIVRCVRDPKLEVYPYWPSRFVAWLNTMAPSLLDALTMRYLRDRLRAQHQD
jgi:short-subunit dehydrogenase